MNTNMNTTTTIKPKTRICENIKKTGTCVYGKNCHFAHDVKELTVSKCAFGQRCVFIHYADGKVCNKVCYTNGSKICKFLHPNENISELFLRLESKPLPPVPSTPPQLELITPMTFPPLAPKKAPPLPTPAPAFDLTPLRLDLDSGLATNSTSSGITSETPTDPDEWVTVRGKKPPTVEAPPPPPVVKREMKMVATVNAKDLLQSVEKWVESGLTELVLTIEYD